MNILFMLVGYTTIVRSYIHNWVTYITNSYSVHDSRWTDAGMFFCDGASGLASLAICHEKSDSPLQNHEYPGWFGKAQRKKEKKVCVFFIRIRIYFIVCQIIKFHRHSGVYSENFHTRAIKMNAHDQNVFCVQ